MSWNKRSDRLELIDLGPQHYTQEEYLDCLHQLGKVGKYLGGDRASYQAIDHLIPRPASILDVGCGGGDFTQKLGKRYSSCQIKGIDISGEAIDYAKKHHQRNNVSFDSCLLCNVSSKSYDVVIATLVCHHLNDDELILFLKDCTRIAKKAVIINDLHRHPLAWFAFKLSAPLIFRNRLITHDGALSIKRAFTRKDWQKYLEALHAKGKITWHWPFRWIVTLEPDSTI